MPPLFQFLTVLAFKIFVNEKVGFILSYIFSFFFSESNLVDNKFMHNISYLQVDVAIIEVGLGGRNDSTNVVMHPSGLFLHGITFFSLTWLIVILLFSILSVSIMNALN